MLKRKKQRSTSAPRRRSRLFAPAALAAVLATAPDAGAVAHRPSPRESAKEIVPGLATRAKIERMAQHPDRERRIALAALLPDVLAMMPTIERTELVSSWSLSRSPYLRLAMARALRHLSTHPRTPGTITAIEHLARDPDPSVRAAIAEAAWLRRREDPGRLIGVLHVLAEDDHLFVREVARLALGDA